MSKFPHRAIVQMRKEFSYDNYNPRLDLKPDGLWYSIDDCIYQYTELFWGSFVYELKLEKGVIKDDKLLIIKNFKDLEKFHNLYSSRYHVDKKRDKWFYYTLDQNKLMVDDDGYFNFIDWGLVAKKYGGFEIKNYLSIRKSIPPSYREQYQWFTSFRFSSGCIWDLTLVKDVTFFRKLTKNETLAYKPRPEYNPEPFKKFVKNEDAKYVDKNGKEVLFYI